MKTRFLNLTDGYKLDHRSQYPRGTEGVYSNLTPRAGRDPESKGITWVGAQYAVARLLLEDAQVFFDTPLHKVLKDYKRRLDGYLPGNRIQLDHIEFLHKLGYMPLEIKALPEGAFVHYGVPCMTIENTRSECAWLTNYVETPLSTLLWPSSTSATTARRYRQLLDNAARVSGGDPGFVPYQGHDFSFRGMMGLEAPALSGMGHLVYFDGTDSLPAIDLIDDYYGYGYLNSVGCSVPATEHSVMCAGGQTDELETFKRLLDLYPSGIVSVVSDTWDLWKVLTEYLPALKDKILARPGKLVIRPDSGDPVKILCGDPDAPLGSPQYKGVVQLLWDVFGGNVNKEGCRELDGHIGAIYGDSITVARAQEICGKLWHKGFASTNVVLGIGSYTYQYTTRDVHGFAIKATWSQQSGREVIMQKDPVTDSGTKKSARGRLVVLQNSTTGRYELVDGLYKYNAPDGDLRGVERFYDYEGGNRLQTIFKDGAPRGQVTWEQVQKRAIASLSQG